MWFVYIVKCSDDSFYTGSSNDVEARVKRHNSGKGGKYTRSRKPVVLIYTEQLDSKEQALKREIEIKSFSRENKKKLIHRTLSSVG